MISQMSWNVGHLGSKTSSLSQIKEIPCGHCRGLISCSNDLKIGQNVCCDETLDSFGFWVTWGHKVGH